VDYKDYYQILGVPRDADEKAIKRAYRKLARQYHPDHNPGDSSAETRFKEATEAYEVLSDPDKRSKYDRFGQAWNQQGGAPGGFDWGAWQPGPGQGRVYTAEDIGDLFGSRGGGFSDFFEALFGRAGGPGGASGRAPGGRVQGGAAPRAVGMQGQDIEQNVSISLAEAYHGATRLFSKDGRRLEVAIPPGVRSGSRVRMRGEGMPGPGGGTAGDLYLVVQVDPDRRFERQDNDLTVHVEVPLSTAVLGGEVRVPTLAGDLTLKIPSETQPGRRIRLRGKGMPLLKDPTKHGDLFAIVDVRLPTGLTDEERGLFERLRELRAGS
jgi:curved DNA-binding protein